MRILLVNKFHYYRGGSEKYYFELAKLLKENGHTVGFFSMNSDENICTGDKEYFVDEIDLNTGSKLKAFDVIYSPANKKQMTKALEDFKPDVVHINNFQRQLSASIIDAIKEKNIPIVMTAHDLNPICPCNILLYQGQICEKCLESGYMNCIKNSCIKDSKAKSLIGVLEHKFYQHKKIWNKIDVIISPSEFNKNKLETYGAKSKQNISLPNFVYDIDTSKNEIGDYAFYLGRLSAEKGILNIIKSIGECENAKLIIAGDGPYKDEIVNYISQNKLENKVSLVGYLNQEQAQEYLTKCRCLIFPSICYENCPYSILEAMAAGKPIVASDIGGISELVKDDVNGYLYKFANTDELTEKMKKIFESDEIVKRLSNNSKELYKQKYSAQRYYENLMNIYNSVIKE